LRGIPGSACHSLSQMPLSCPVAPPSQRELHKDGGGGGMAGRARAARAPKAKRCATFCDTFSVASCAASFTCSSFMCHLRAGVGGGSRLGRRAPQHTFFAPQKGCVHRVLYMLALHEPQHTFFCPPETLRSPRPLHARASRVDRHCHWACRTNKRLQTFKERLARR